MVTMKNNDLIYFSQLLIALSISFISLLLIYKLYYKIRCRYYTFANCWFCNENAKVPYSKKNSWICPNSVCEQYNGFTKEGDYNKKIEEQFNHKKNMIRYVNLNPDYVRVNTKAKLASKCLCNDCNKNQFFKMQKLSQFDPDNERNYAKEFEKYKCRIEEIYRLCPNCEGNLREILREKKKMILGSKFLASLLRGFDTKYAEKKVFNMTTKINKFATLATFILILAIINMFYIIKQMKILKDFFPYFINVAPSFSTSVTSCLILISHSLKNVTVEILNNNFLRKLFLLTKFFSTFFFKFFGIKLSGFYFDDYCTYVSVIPICSIFLTFVQNIIDHFRLTQYTILLTIWSFHFGALNIEYINETATLKIFTAIAVLVFSIPKINKGYLKIDNARNNFHKIHSDILKQKPANIYFNVENNFKLSHFNIVKKDQSSRNFKMDLSNLLESSSPLKSNIKYDFPICANSYKKFCNGNSKLSRNNYENFYNNSNIWCNNNFCFHSFNSSQNNYRQNQFIWKPTVLPEKQKIYKDTTISQFNQHCPMKQKRAPVITPSRFCFFKSHNFDCGTKSWISGGFFNLNQPNTDMKSGDLLDVRSKDINNSDTFSRASSKSSGFESNSSLPNEQMVLTRRDTKGINHSNKKFSSQEINSRQSHDLSRQLPNQCSMHSLDNKLILENSINLINPMSQNTNLTYKTEYHYNDWNKQRSSRLRKNYYSIKNKNEIINCFNLNKITDVLPIEIDRQGKKLLEIDNQGKKFLEK